MSSTIKQKPYDNQVKRLNTVLTVLSKRLGEAESRLPPFKKVTSDCCERILKFGTEANYLTFYLKQWFRAFLGIRDECMVLLTGELVRNYHAALHESYLHDRHEENEIYSKQCSLSLCSSNGIDFEYRRLVKRFGSKMAFDAIADRSEKLEESLHVLYKRIDECYESIESAVRSLQGCRVVSNLKHRAETLNLVIKNSRIELAGDEFRRFSHALSLITVLEDHPDIIGRQAATLERSSRNKRRRGLDDSDDDHDVDEKGEKEEKVLNFEFSASVEEIKKAYQPIVQQQAENIVDNVPLPVLSLQRMEVDGFEPLPFFKVPFAVQDPRPGMEASYCPLRLCGQSAAPLLDNLSKICNSSFLATTDLLTETMKLLWLQPSSTIETSEDQTKTRLELLHPQGKEDLKLWIPKAVLVDGQKYSKGSCIPQQSLTQGKRYLIICESQEDVISCMDCLQRWVEGGTRQPRYDWFIRQRVLWKHRDLISSCVTYIKKKETAANKEEEQVVILNYDFSCDCCGDRASCPGDVGSQQQQDVNDEAKIEKDLCVSIKRLLFLHLSPDRTLNIRISSLSSSADFWLLLSSSQMVQAIDCGLHAFVLQRYLSQSEQKEAIASLTVEELDLSQNHLIDYLDFKSLLANQELQTVLGDELDVLLLPEEEISNEKRNQILKKLLHSLLQKEWTDPWSQVVFTLFSNASRLMVLRLDRCSRSTLETVVILAGLVFAAISSSRRVSFVFSSDSDDLDGLWGQAVESLLSSHVAEDVLPLTIHMKRTVNCHLPLLFSSAI
eukprot:gene213-226_t